MTARNPKVLFGVGVLCAVFGISKASLGALSEESSPDRIVGKTFRLERVYLLSVHVPSDNVEKVVDSISAAVGLEYGKYDKVAYTDAEGSEQYRPRSGSKAGAKKSAVRTPSRIVTVSLVYDPAVLQKAIESIYQAHSYEEPVIYITEGWRSRSTDPDENNSNRWWNQKPK